MLMDFSLFFIKGKKAAETWQLILIVLAIFLIVVMLLFYKDIAGAIKGMLSQLLGIF